MKQPVLTIEHKPRQENNRGNPIASSKMGNPQGDKTKVLLVLYWSLIYYTGVCTYVWYSSQVQDQQAAKVLLDMAME